MSTNYYAIMSKYTDNFTEVERDMLMPEDYESDNSGEYLVHLGLSSAGWRFSLHVYPYLGIMGTYDVFTKLIDNSVKIINEYGETISIKDFEAELHDRRHVRSYPYKVMNRNGEYVFVNDEFEYTKVTGKRLDRYGLIIHDIDKNHCIGNGSANERVDYIIGNFS